MATRQSTVDELLDALAGAGRVTTRKMFGEYCVYLDDKPVALVCDDTLYVKPTAAGRELRPDGPEGPPYPGAKPYLIVPTNEWTDRESLRRLVQATFFELPQPKPRRR